MLTVLRATTIDATTMSVYFARPIGFEYDAGDWMDLTFPGQELNGGKTYSFSSSPTEAELAITFKTGLSPFKKALQNVQPGDEMVITQYGNDYRFTLKEHRSSVLLAGGIGIAPFRSMLKEMADTDNKDEAQLIYLNKGDSYVFHDEIERWKTQLPRLRVDYIDTKELNRKKREKLLLHLINKSADYFFIAGPEGMVESTEHLLIDNGVDVKEIRIDSFGGY